MWMCWFGCKSCACLVHYVAVMLSLPTLLRLYASMPLRLRPKDGTSHFKSGRYIHTHRDIHYTCVHSPFVSWLDFFSAISRNDHGGYTFFFLYSNVRWHMDAIKSAEKKRRLSLRPLSKAISDTQSAQCIKAKQHLLSEPVKTIGQRVMKSH